MEEESKREIKSLYAVGTPFSRSFRICVKFLMRDLIAVEGADKIVPYVEVVG